MVYFVFKTENGKSLIASNLTLFGPGKTPGITINSITNFLSTDASGAATTNGVTYNVYAFKTTGTSYTVNYSCAGDTIIYVLAVGGGGGGGAYGCGGGGAGGVVMTPAYISGSGTITISVGSGGSGASGSPGAGTVGGSTTVTMNSTTIIAGGGGASGTNTLQNGSVNGGSGAGGLGGANYNYAAGNAVNTNNNYANKGGAPWPTTGGDSAGGGGGGAGTVGLPGSVSLGGVGGNGIQCFLPGIAQFTPSGTAYGTYYWGGGGGGSGGNGSAGGIGGGGGGSGSGAGGAGITNGSPGSTNAGNGGANTGGGGGGAFTSTGGNGGSGIVVIAFPSSSTLISSQAAVLPASIFSSNLYNATLNNAVLSKAAYTSIKGAYGCSLLNYNYFGPIMTLRHSLDTVGAYTQNFYSDICGNLGTGYLGTGQPVSTWLANAGANTTYAYVTKWYGQGMDTSFNAATQYTLASQPVYDVSYGLINFGYTTSANAPSSWTSNAGNAYFDLPNGAYPIGDSSFCYSFSYKYVATPTNIPYGAGVASATPFAGGLTTPASGSNASNITPWMQGSQYYYSFWNYDYATGPAPLFNSSTITTATIKYVSNNGNGTRYAYVNKAPATTPSSGMTAVRTQSPLNNGIGSWPLTSTDSSRVNNYFNGQMINFFVFSSALTAGSDQSIIESSPTVFSPLPPMSLTITSLTTTTFALTWTAVTNATTYVMYVNSTPYGIVSSGQTITPLSNSPWIINVYAYNATNNLLASGYTNTSFPTTNLLFDFYAGSGTSTTTNGSSITSWTDSRMGVVASNTGTATFNTTIQNGLPMISGGILKTPSIGTGNVPNWTHFVVFKTGSTVSSSGTQGIFENPATNGIQIGFSGNIDTSKYSSCYNFTAWAAINSNATYAVNTVYLAVTSFSLSGTTATYIYRTNGIDTTTGGSGNNGATTTTSNNYVSGQYIVTLGSFGGSTPAANSGYIGEQILFNTKLPLATISQIEQYLAYKWNIAIGSTPAVPTSSSFTN